MKNLLHITSRLVVSLVFVFSAHAASAVESKPSSPLQAQPKVSAEERMGKLLQDNKALDVAIKAGMKSSFFCANCHGVDGNSASPEVPNLAGQNPAYLLEQIHKFADGRRRNEFMQGMIKVLSEDDKANISAYYASMSVKPGKVANPVLVARGKDLFLKICQRCHGVQGRGSQIIARIAGQKAEYLVLSLTRYRNGTGERIDPYMAANTKNLSDADINALAAYISSMP